MSPEIWNLLIVITTVWSGLLLLAVAFLAAAAHGDRRSIPSPVPQTGAAQTAGGHSDASLEGRTGVVESGSTRHMPLD